jgi:tRNA-dihydrouridine synthase
MKQLVESTSVPLIANGDLYTKEAVKNMMDKSGCASVMLARPTLVNASALLYISNKSEPLGQLQQFREYLIECIRYDAPYQIVKYTIMEMMVSRRHTNEVLEKLIKAWPDLEFGRMDEFERVQNSRNLRDICETFGIAERYDNNTVAINSNVVLAHKFEDSYFDGASSVPAIRKNTDNESGPTIKKQKLEEF